MRPSIVRAGLIIGTALLILPIFASAGQAAGAPGLRYEIWVELDAAAKMLTAKEEIVWTNPTQETVPDMLLHLYWNAFKNEASTFMRESAAESIFRAGDAPEDGSRDAEPGRHRKAQVAEKPQTLRLAPAFPSPDLSRGDDPKPTHRPCPRSSAP